MPYDPADGLRGSKGEMRLERAEQPHIGLTLLLQTCIPPATQMLSDKLSGRNRK